MSLIVLKHSSFILRSSNKRKSSEICYRLLQPRNCCSQTWTSYRTQKCLSFQHLFNSVELCMSLPLFATCVQLFAYKVKLRDNICSPSLELFSVQNRQVISMRSYRRNLSLLLAYFVSFLGEGSQSIGSKTLSVLDRARKEPLLEVFMP